mgnify:CR=1 FL=1
MNEVAAEGEYRIEKFRCGGKGGQNVNKVETGVRVIHIPTGTVTRSTEERSQFRNKQKAMERMREKLAATSFISGTMLTSTYQFFLLWFLRKGLLQIHSTVPSRPLKSCSVRKRTESRPRNKF